MSRRRRKSAMKITNEYSEVLGPLYARMPKAVLAAIVVSWARCPRFDDVPSAVMDEWQALYDNGIVPQRPPRAFRTKFAGSSEEQGGTDAD